MWSTDPLGVLKIFSEEISGQNYFHNNKKQLFAFSTGLTLQCKSNSALVSKTIGLSRSLHPSVPKTGVEGLFHLSVLDEPVKSINF